MFESEFHVVGIQDFMIIKELDLDWRKEVRSWKKITSGDLNEVRPRIGQRHHKPKQDENKLHLMWFPLFCLVQIILQILTSAIDLNVQTWYSEGGPI